MTTFAEWFNLFFESSFRNFSKYVQSEEFESDKLMCHIASIAIRSRANDWNRVYARLSHENHIISNEARLKIEDE